MAMVHLQPERTPGRRADWAYVNLGDSARLTLMLAPLGRGSFAEQVQEVLAKLKRNLELQPHLMAVTSQTVFLRSASEQVLCEQMLKEFYGRMPVTNYVLQAPCCGAALAIELWAIGGPDVRVDHFGPYATAVTYDSVRWVYCAGIQPDPAIKDCYGQGIDGLERMRACLKQAGSSFHNIVRTWFYLGGITDHQGDQQRYHELNRARADFYKDVKFCCSLLDPNSPRGVFPASTGIGMAGRDVVMSCMTLQTRRDDVFLLPLENPQQTPAYAYHPKYSPRSPKFARAMALGLGNYVTTWISGTASIVDSESRHIGNLEKQTEQTIDNIEGLIAPENFALHGVKGAGAGLHDMAKIRVYIKRPQDFAACKAVCERRFGPVPAIYAVADVCRPELLVEIEGIAFSRFSPPPLSP
jgi:enamine deaminase RidA (YjgF/YER057c/UK114 family)